MSLQTVTRPLGILPNVSLTSNQLRKVRAIESYDLWFVVERLKQDGTIEPYLIDEVITEFKRYMALVALEHKGLAMISRKIDAVWHSFILFTFEYQHFCKQVFGKFIHHAPQTSRESLPLQTRENFIHAYNKIFGELPLVWDNEDTESAEENGGAFSAISGLPTDCGSGFVA